MNPQLVWALGLSAVVVVTAALVNRLAPTFRSRLRRVAILFVLYIAVLGAAVVASWLGSDVWARRLTTATALLQAFTIVNVVATLTLALVLPRAGIRLPMIATDLLVGFGYVLATLGAIGDFDAKSLLATSAVVSAVLAISLQSTLGNVLGGVALQLDGSIHEGDWIQLDTGKQGRVRSIRWRHTVVETRDWETIIVPNALLLAGNIMILGKRGGDDVPQRMWVWFNVDFRYPPPRVIEVVTEALRAAPIEGVAPDPLPNCVCMDFTRERRESFATYAVRYWLLDLAVDDPTSSRVRARVFTALRRAGIPLAIPAATHFVEVHDEDRTHKRERRRLGERLTALRTLQLFRSFTEEELRTLAEGMSHVIYTAGEVITRQGAVAHWLYIITHGSAEVRTRVGSDSKLVATLDAPDVFGEMGLMTGEPRYADVVAKTDVDCFRLGKETFEQVLTERPEIANELSERLATRRLELMAIRDGHEPGDRRSAHDTERERILGSIKTFFGL